MTINLEQQPLPSAFVRQSQDELVKMILLAPLRRTKIADIA